MFSLIDKEAAFNKLSCKPKTVLLLRVGFIAANCVLTISRLCSLLTVLW